MENKIEKKKVIKSEKVSKSNKLKTIKKILPVVLTLSLAGSAMGYLYNYNKNKPVDDYKVKGYTDLNLRNIAFVDGNDFVILNAGDHNDTKTNLFDSKIQFLNENNIPTGLIIDSNSAKLCDIYEDALYAKSVVSKYNINYPIFFNVDSIFSNEDLRIFEKIELISAFLEKTSVNGIYVGLYGNEENLSRIALEKNDGNKYSDTFKDYDCLVNTNNDDIKFDGNYSIMKDKSGKLHAKDGLDEIIADHDLNDKDNFVDDESIIYNEGDNILDIAEEYNLSISDIKNYNNIKGKIIPGTILNIPNRIKKGSVNVKGQQLSDTILNRGLDLSFYQDNIDWNKISKQVDFIINRVADFCNKDKNTGAYLLDTSFENNVYKCQQYGIDVGVYGLTRAMNKDDAVKEANFIVEKIRNMNIKYPVYFDLEKEHYDKMKKLLTNEQIKEIIDSFCNIIKDAGYIPGIYTSTSSYDELVKSNSDINKYELWIANSKDYSKELEYKNLDEFEKCLKKNKNVSMIQLTECGKIDGIKGSVDINCCYNDYSNKIINSNEENIPKFNKLIFNNDTVVSSGLYLVTLSSFLYLKKKRNKVKRLVK